MIKWAATLESGAKEMAETDLFKWGHFEKTVILTCVCWYLRYELSRPRGNNERSRSESRSHDDLSMGAAAPEVEKRSRPYLRPTNDSNRVEETYIKVKGKWKYLYRAVDSKGNTIDFLLTAKRDKEAAKRFLRKAVENSHHCSPRVINADKNPAYRPAVEELKSETTLPESCNLRQCKYLNNVIEQDHRFIKRRVNYGLGFGGFHTAKRTLQGYEAMNMIRKGQIEGAAKGDIEVQVKFFDQLFESAA